MPDLLLPMRALLDFPTPSSLIARVTSTLPRSDTFSWGHGPIRFELSCRDEELLAHIAGVLRYWQAGENAKLARRWIIELNDEQTWEARAANWPSEKFETISRGTPQQVTVAVEYDSVHQLLEYPQHFSSLHSALLAKTEGEGQSTRGVAIVGPCEAGKSTLACALWKSGWSLLSDDMTFFHLDGTAQPSQRRVSLRRASRELLGDDLWLRAASTPGADEFETGLLFHPHEVDKRVWPEETRLSAIVFLARRAVETGPAELRKMNAAQAALALLPYSNMAQRAPFPEALARVAALAEEVPVYDLGRGPLPEMIASVNSLLL